MTDRTEPGLADHGRVPISVDAPCYSRQEVMEILRLRDPDTLWRWARRGEGPPFIRIGAKHSRLLFPRAAFWEWVERNTYSSTEEADEATG